MLLLLTLITAVITAILGCPPVFEDPVVRNTGEKINYRLPQNVQPIRYNITLEPRLEPNLNPAPFNGSVSIEFKALENTNNITLHTRLLNISENSISIVHTSGVNVYYSNILRDNTREFYIIQLKTALLKGETYILTFGSYNGTLHLDNGGFYLAKYFDARGNERRFATTQFQSTNARKAFPSFDEPHMKASFVVNLIRNKNFTSISNEAIIYTKNLGNGRFQDTYRETVKMSTYLAAFVVSDYAHTNRTDGQRVFADQESVEKGEAEYALRVGIEVLNGLQQFLNVSYSLNKMDQIAIPDDFFAPGAMENWGLVTYRKSYIVFPYENATTSEIQKTVQIVAHEFAHQWFGNLITCSWWKYIWLNEGFANYFESYAAALKKYSLQRVWNGYSALVDPSHSPSARVTNFPLVRNMPYSKLVTEYTIMYNKDAIEWNNNGVTINTTYVDQLFKITEVRPKWRLMDLFVLTSLQRAFESDSLNTTKPMNHEADYPGSGPPSYIAYQKAGSVIRMFAHFLTENIFQKALTIYLNKNAFQPVQPPDLYQALQQVVDAEGAGFLLGNLTVSRILETWDSQEGYPVVNVTRDYKTGRVLLQQRRFFLKDSSLKDNSTWYIPINFHSLNASNYSNTTADFWMTERTQTVNQSFANSSWLIVNKQQTGYYRVNYDKTNWNRLAIFLNKNDTNSIHVLNRAQLIDDSFNLARAGQLDYEIPLNLSKYLRREIDYVPLTSFLNAQNFLNIMLAATPEYSIFQSYINNSLAGAYKYLSSEEHQNDEHLDKLNRITVLSWLCNVGNVQCRNDSLDKLRNWKDNNTNLITANLETPVFCGAIRIGNQNDWDFLYQKYEIAGNTSQRSRILNSLGCSENKTILNKFLDKVIQNNSTLRVGDRFLAFRAVYNAGNIGLNTSFEYIDEHFAQLYNTVNLPAMFEEIAAKFTTDEQLNQLTALINKHGGQISLYDKAIKNTKENIQWSKQYIGSIRNWLVDYSKY